MKYLYRGLAVVSQISAYIIGVAVFAASFFGLAYLINTPSVLAILSILFSTLSISLFSWFAAKLFKLKKSRKYALGQGFVASLLWIPIVWFILFRPLIPTTEQYQKIVPAGVEYWKLSTGSNIAVRKIKSKGLEKKEPIIFLHGGPGAYSVDLKPTWKIISELSNYSHDIYFYDQIGGGLSDHLTNITDYTLGRHLDDLNEVYKKTKSDKIIIIGSSFGATLGANYMARFPKNVAAAVFSGPGPIYKPDWENGSDGTLDSRMTNLEKQTFNKAINQPRLIAAIILSEINPKAAIQFLPTYEATSFFDKIANEHYMGYTVCDSKNITTKTKGYGFWSNRMTGESLDKNQYDPKVQLEKNDTPVLILRGSCDYKLKEVAEQYHSVFPKATYKAYELAGHMLLWEKPQDFINDIGQFLDVVTLK